MARFLRDNQVQAIAVGHVGPGMDSEDLRLAVYRSFASTGRVPDPRGLAGQLASDVPAVIRGLRELAGARHLVLTKRAGS